MNLARTTDLGVERRKTFPSPFRAESAVASPSGLLRSVDALGTCRYDGGTLTSTPLGSRVCSSSIGGHVVVKEQG